MYKLRYILSWAAIIAICLYSSSIKADGSIEIPDYKTGIYCELGGRADPDIIGGEIGLYRYQSEILSLSGGLSFLASEDLADLFTGLNVGARLNTPGPLQAFIGLGVFLGYSKERASADNDWIDNDDDGFTDEYGEEKEIIDNVLGSIYPEAGIHLWISDKTRLTLTAKYQITTEGSDHNFWMYNFGIAIPLN